jgi:hypothetical protein
LTKTYLFYNNTIIPEKKVYYKKVKKYNPLVKKIIYTMKNLYKKNRDFDQKLYE